MEKQPLVSIVIITYNSAEYVLETLDSAMNQTYPNIEIIVTDDCSTDNTVDLCQNWIKHHRQLGKNLKLICAEKNTGTADNCNRGLYAAKGEWIKIIAGDDLLLPDAIESYISFANSSPNIDVVFANLSRFSGTKPNYAIEECELHYKKLFFLNSKITAQKQYNILRHTFVGSGPTFFAKTAVLKDVGGYDTRFYLQEDHPMFIKLTKNGHQFYLLDKVAVLWRKNENSVTHSKNNKDALFGNHKIRMIKEYKYLYLKEELNIVWKELLCFSLWIQNKVIDTGNSYNSKRSLFYFTLYRAIDPFIWYNRILCLREKLMKL